MTALQKLINRFDKGYHICVGLDTDINKIPEHFLEKEDPIFEFNKEIIENTADISAAYKLNFAFYEKEGAKGLESLERTLALIPDDVLSIADAKRGDIGNTAMYYASSVFETMNFDSVTLAPYMGFDSIKPFADFTDKLMFILVLTSNKSAVDFEKQKLENGDFLYQHVLKTIASWNDNNNLGIVFGATQSEELSLNINNFTNLPVLLPGVGSQGGSLEDITKIFSANNNNNFLVNSSRAVIYADPTKEFAKVAREVIKNYNNVISLNK